MTQNNLPKEIVDKIEEDAENATTELLELADSDDYVKPIVKKYLSAAALHYSQIIQDAKEELSVMSEHQKILLNDKKQLKAENERLKNENERILNELIKR